MRLITVINLKVEPRASSRLTSAQHRHHVRTEERRVCTVVYPGCGRGYIPRVVYTRHTIRVVYTRVYSSHPRVYTRVYSSIPVYTTVYHSPTLGIPRKCTILPPWVYPWVYLSGCVYLSCWCTSQGVGIPPVGVPLGVLYRVGVPLGVLYPGRCTPR